MMSGNNNLSEFVATWSDGDKAIEMSHMLRMLEVALNVHNMYGDNFTVISSSAIPDKTQKKRHTALPSLRVREAITAKILLFNYVNRKK